MRILSSETKDKASRVIRAIAVDELLDQLREDRGYHEVIPMIDSNVLVRIYVDIDCYSGSPSSTVLYMALQALNDRFKLTDNDWAVCSCHRMECDLYKTSYHIISRRHSIRLNTLRSIMNKLKLTVNSIDTTVYFFDMNDRGDNGFFRLPNQTKDSINKPSPPLKIESGDLSDFLVTDVGGLIQFRD